MLVLESRLSEIILYTRFFYKEHQGTQG